MFGGHPPPHRKGLKGVWDLGVTPLWNKSLKLYLTASLTFAHFKKLWYCAAGEILKCKVDILEVQEFDLLAPVPKLPSTLKTFKRHRNLCLSN